ncbi:MAG: hypothetical protein H8E46_03420, partial [FCB group bacterium]|nr:hypothetical protein [FCB group bacterium]
MKYFTFTFLSILILSSITLAQALDTMWTKTFGGSTEDYGECVQQTTDGGYIITGYTNSFGAGGRDVYLIKTDTNGDELWTQTLGGSNNDWSYSVQQTTDGGYIIAGQTSSYGVGAGTYNVYLVKTDMNGNESWHQTYGGSNNDVGYSVQQTTDGGYIIGGYTESYGAGSFDVYLIKTDAMGDESWSRTFGGSSNDVGYSIQQTIDGGYIIGGYTNSYGAGGNDVYLIKTDTEGNESWHQTYGGSTGDTGKSVQQTTDGGYIIAGNTDSYGAGSLDVYLIKTDVNGNEDWTKTYGGSNWDVGGCAQQTSDEGYIITGSTGSYGVGDYNVYLIKTDTNGDTLCTQTYGGSDNDRGYSVQQTTDGGYIVIGYTASYGVGEIDVYLIKLEREDEFYFTCDEPNLPGFIGSTATFYSELTNITAGEVTVHLNLDTTGYPADWDCSWSVGGVALPSFIFDWET